jgi:hypothetical protein
MVLVGEFINLAYFAYYFYLNHYLPAPFVWDKNNSFMDFYAPLLWVINGGFYTVYESVYPALNYFFLKLFSLAVHSTFTGDPFQLRESYPGLTWVLIAFYLFILIVVTNIGAWAKVRDQNHILIFLACVMSVPCLFAIERGNLIFLALLFLALYLQASRVWSKAIYFGLLVNVKPYFIFLLLPYFNRKHRDFSVILKLLISAAVIFFSLGFFANIDIANFIGGYLKFGKGAALSEDGMLSLPNTLSALYPIKRILFDGDGSKFAFWFSLLKVFSIAAPLVLLLVALVKPLSRLELLIASIVLIANFSASTGGYIFLIYILLLPYIIKDRAYRKILVLIFLIYALPVDWIKVAEFNYPVLSSYLGGGLELGKVNLWISLGSVLRPIFNFSIMILFTSQLLKKYPLSGTPKSIDSIKN